MVTTHNIPQIRSATLHKTLRYKKAEHRRPSRGKKPACIQKSGNKNKLNATST